MAQADDINRENRDLVDRFREGDPDAFQALVARYDADLAAHARRRLDGALRRKVSVADVVQEAKLVAFERCADFTGDDGEALKHWLLGIVRNRARKAVERYADAGKRAVGREVSRGDRPDTLQVPGAPRSPSAAVRKEEANAALQAARARLEPDERELLRLVYDEHLNLREAAERLGRTHDAVRKQHARAVIRLGRAFRLLAGEDDGSR